MKTKKKIAVIGSINMDMTARAEKIPEKGETILADSVTYVPGGKGANQAVAAARLGGDVTMYGCVGDDAFGRQLIDNFKANGVRAEHIDLLPGVSSGLAMIVVAENDNVITVIPGANQFVTPDYIDRHMAEIEQADLFLFQNEIPMETITYAASYLSSKGKTIIYNPAPAKKAPKELVTYSSYLTPNEHEARIVLDDLKSPLESLLFQYEPKLIVTLGSKGIASASGSSVLSLPAKKVSIVDTTGAGDTMNGAFAYALSVGMSFEESLDFANTAAGLSIQKAGAQAGMPTLEEVKRLLLVPNKPAPFHQSS